MCGMRLRASGAKGEMGLEVFLVFLPSPHLALFGPRPAHAIVSGKLHCQLEGSKHYRGRVEAGCGSRVSSKTPWWLAHSEWSLLPLVPYKS